MYRKLLISDRFRSSSRGSKAAIEEVESDRSRVLYSAAFRRLQRKTQVFPLESNAAVRTRLTHSLEVAHVGRFLSSKILDRLESEDLKSKWGLNGDMGHVFSTNVEIACLLHDIGNPPFGHFGEVAVSRWFKKNNTYLKDSVFQKDFTGFDGNPQGFRIVSRLAGSDGHTGMNLTLTQLASILKYPVVNDEESRYKKFGIFQSERALLDKLRDKFDLSVGQRFPLAYLMEAADDISYCLSDIEDGVEKDVVNFDQILNAIEDGVGDDVEVTKILSGARAATEAAPSVDRVVSFRSYIIRHMVQYAADRYVSEHDRILSGQMDDLICPSSPEGRLLSVVKMVVRTLVYKHQSIQSLEIAGLSVISGLLDHFGLLLDLSREQMIALSSGKRGINCDVESRVFDYIAKRHKDVYLRLLPDSTDLEEIAARARMIVDYISGMTDLFALETHQIFGGIRI